MGKGSGGTKQSTPSNPKGLTPTKEQVISSYERFSSYDSSAWEKTLFDSETDGFLVTSRQRIKDSQKNKNMREVFEKEQGMCKKLVSFGFQVEHLAEISGVSSPDINIKKHGPLIRINGKTADLKQLGSANNIGRQAKEAISKKGADLIVFEFTSHSPAIQKEINKLTAKGIHGYYYFSDKNTYKAF